MTTETFTASPADVELLPGYYVEPGSGAWLTLPWPANLAELPPSLGPGVIRWCELWLTHHLTGDPWRFTPGQRRFLHLWYSVRPDGKWVYRSGVKRGAKGTGKDPFMAAFCLVELVGPVRFAGWDGDRPLGVAHRMPLVQIAANSEAQAVDVLRVANAMVSAEMRDEFGLDLGETRTNVLGGGRLELLTASMKTSEGDPATAIGLNESHHMTESSGGHRVAAVARRNVAKSPGGAARLLEFTNAHEQGADSVAERSFEAWQTQVAGKTLRSDILYDSREAPPDIRLDDEMDLMRGLEAAYADAPWESLERLAGEAMDLRTTPAETIRYYLNGLGTREDAWLDPRKFDDRARADVVVADREQVAMFLDCSKSEDATGLAGSRISDGHVFVLGKWQRPHGHRGRDWLVSRAEVDATVRAAWARFAVVAFYVDPSPARDDQTEALYWAELIDQWHRDFRDKLVIWAVPGKGQGHAVKFDMRLSQPGGAERNRRFTEAAMRCQQDIDPESVQMGMELPDDGQPPLTHDGDPMLRMHAHNARRRPNKWGVSLGKETRDSTKLVDLAVCMAGARLARLDALNSGKLKTGSRKVYSFS